MNTIHVWPKRLKNFLRHLSCNSPQSMPSQHMRTIRFPVNCQPCASRSDFDYLGIQIQTCATSKFHLVVSHPDFKIATLTKSLHIPTLRLESSIGDARRPHSDELCGMHTTKHVAYSLFAFAYETADYHIAL